MQDINVFPIYSTSDDYSTSKLSQLTRIINIKSFGYLHGRPKHTSSDLVIDVRCFNNVQKATRDRLDGRSRKLQKELLDDRSNKDILDGVIRDVERDVDRWVKTDSPVLNIYVGCDAGKHRSVATACLLQQHISLFLHKANNTDTEIHVHHTELDQVISHDTNSNVSKAHGSKKSRMIERTKNRDKKLTFGMSYIY